MDFPEKRFAEHVRRRRLMRERKSDEFLLLVEQAEPMVKERLPANDNGQRRQDLDRKVREIAEKVVRKVLARRENSN